jgi:hypothetical protein
MKLEKLITPLPSSSGVLAVTWIHIVGHRCR